MTLQTRLADLCRAMLAHMLEPGEDGSTVTVDGLHLDDGGLVSEDGTVWRLPTPEEGAHLIARLSACLLDTPSPSKRSH